MLTSIERGFTIVKKSLKEGIPNPDILTTAIASIDAALDTKSEF